MAASFSSLATTNLKAAVASVDDIEDLVTVNGAPFVNAPDELPVQTANAVIVGTGTAPGLGAVVESSGAHITTAGDITVLDLVGANPLRSAVYFDNGGAQAMTVGTTGTLTLASTGAMTLTGSTVDLGANAIATTPANTDNDTSVATTAFINNLFSNWQNDTTSVLTDGTTASTCTSNSAFQIIGKTLFYRCRLNHTTAPGAGNLRITLNIGRTFANNYCRSSLVWISNGALPADQTMYCVSSNSGTSFVTLLYVAPSTGLGNNLTGASVGASGFWYFTLTADLN